MVIGLGMGHQAQNPPAGICEPCYGQGGAVGIPGVVLCRHVCFWMNVAQSDEILFLQIGKDCFVPGDNASFSMTDGKIQSGHSPSKDAL